VVRSGPGGADRAGRRPQAAEAGDGLWAGMQVDQALYRRQFGAAALIFGAVSVMPGARLRAQQRLYRSRKHSLATLRALPVTLTRLKSRRGRPRSRLLSMNVPSSLLSFEKPSPFRLKSAEVFMSSETFGRLLDEVGKRFYGGTFPLDRIRRRKP
jgi:hypothetical protein